MQTEFWHDSFHGLIPKENYAMMLTQGEETGLTVRLEGRLYNVNLNFGIAHAINILDEGVLLRNPPGVIYPNEIELCQTGYPSTLYYVENGAYASMIKTCMTDELYEAFRLRQYNLVTANYVVEIICSREPDITVTAN